MAPIVALVGPTASGKTALSLELAELLGGPDGVEIISADAMQLYRGMDIGTAKLPPSERRNIRHHQLDVLDVTDTASVAAYQRYARADLAGIVTRGKIPMIVGGSGLYVSGLLDELNFPGTDPAIRGQLEAIHEASGLGPLVEELSQKDPVTAGTIDIKNPRRVIRALEVVRLTGQSYTPIFPRHTSHYDGVVMVGVRREKEILNEAIRTRAEEMFDRGLIEETRGLLECGLRGGETARKATGYAEAIAVIDGKMGLEDAVDSVACATRRLAKKQRTWFGRDPRITWIDIDTGADIPAAARRALSLVNDTRR